MTEFPKSIQPEQHEQAPPEARAEWLRAWREGNLRIPQATIGITSNVGYAVLTNAQQDPSVLREFVASQLPQEAAEFMAKTANYAHAAKMIDRKVDTAEIEQLWSFGTQETIAFLANLLPTEDFIALPSGNSQGGLDEYHRLTNEALLRVEKSREAYSLLQDICSTIQLEIKQHPVADALNIYRESFRKQPDTISFQQHIQTLCEQTETLGIQTPEDPFLNSRRIILTIREAAISRIAEHLSATVIDSLPPTQAQDQKYVEKLVKTIFTNLY